MLTPLDITRRIIEINNNRMAIPSNSVGHNNQITALYMEVLDEIKNGSIDPKSLAHAVLKIQPTFRKQ